MKRGDVVVVSSQGDYGKPRPAVVIQSDALSKSDSVLVSLLTSEVIEAPLFRLTVSPTETNGLKTPSQVMVDKITALRRDKCSPPIGTLDKGVMIALNRMLAIMVGIAD